MSNTSITQVAEVAGAPSTVASGRARTTSDCKGEIDSVGIESEYYATEDAHGLTTINATQRIAKEHAP